MNILNSIHRQSCWKMEADPRILDKLNMLPHAHRCGFNMKPCTVCGGECLCHTATGVVKRCNPKKQPPSIAVLWRTVKCHTHIKRETKKLIAPKLDYISAIFLGNFLKPERQCLWKVKL
jgi:hypothetical protein